jgi:gluconate 5-dehydrogenase
MTVARVVIGAAGFIGRRLCGQLASQPGSLLAVDVTAAPYANPPIVHVEPGDLSDVLASHLAGSARAELFYAAGRVPDLARTVDVSVDAFAAAIADNLTNAYATLRDFAEATEHLGIPAAAVVLSSVGAHRAHRYLVGYDAAKAGLESVVRSFALEYGSRLSTRAVAVGPIAQSASTAADGAQLLELVQLVPQQRYLDLDEVAAAILAFGGPAFDGATGHTLVLDGGLTIQLRPVNVERPPMVTR